MSKTTKEIYDSMKKYYEDNAGEILNDNSKPARIFEALSTELYALYCYGDYTRAQAFVQSATGENLEKLAELRGITRKTPQKATGEVVFRIAQPAEKMIYIPNGIICSVSSKPYLQFVTTYSSFIEIGRTSAVIPAEAISEGSMYNVYPKEIDLMVNAPPGISSVYNAEAFTGGYDMENDESLRMRVINRYAFDPSGVSAGLLESIVMNLEFVTDCYIPRVEKFGTLTVYIATKNNILLDSYEEEIKEALAICELFGVQLEIVLASYQDFSIDLRLKVRANFDKAVIEKELRNVINMLYAQCRIGDAFSLENIEKRALLIDGVLDASAESESAISNTVYSDYGKKLNIKDLAVSYYEA
ncbi:MAG: baseplate J/gp47 family protein [Eubacterium sp.]|nr:baseplate J/gp47 family protein [Eubacterium sp.]